MALARPFAIRPNYVRVERRALKIMRAQSKIKMDTIKIIWLTDDREQRASFEMETGDFEAASRIFAEMVKRLKAEKEDEERKNLGPSLPQVERKGES